LILSSDKVSILPYYQCSSSFNFAQGIGFIFFTNLDSEIPANGFMKRIGIYFGVTWAKNKLGTEKPIPTPVLVGITEFDRTLR